MEQEAVKSFTYRISQATKSEMVVIMYDIILRDIEDARLHFKKEDYSEYERNLKHAERFINELMGTLDFTYDIAIQLRRLYIYAEREIIDAVVKRNPDKLEGAFLVIEGLRKVFAEVSLQDKSGIVMKNSQRMYAGLTYGKGVLNETEVTSTETNRGYLV